MANKEQDPSNCTHDCSTCSANCSSRKEIEKATLKEDSSFAKTIAVISGKGGVGKTMISCLLASELNKKGYKVSILDADITGPSVPKNFGLNEMCMLADDGGILPVETKNGIKAVSVNLMLEDISQPVIWRGPIIAGSLINFYQETHWGKNDYLVIDCPPGTGDVPLTIFQQIKVDGIIVVTTPQDLVSMIVSKAVNMAKMMDIPILGIVENMSYIKCPDCGKKIPLFGQGYTSVLSNEFDVPVLAHMPLDPKVTELVDFGKVEDVTPDEEFKNVIETIEKI